MLPNHWLMDLNASQDAMSMVWLVLFPLLLLASWLGNLVKWPLLTIPLLLRQLPINFDPCSDLRGKYGANSVIQKSLAIWREKEEQSQEEGFFWVGWSASPTTHHWGTKNKHKVKYLCMICKENHFTKDCPQITKIHQYLEWGNSSS